MHKNKKGDIELDVIDVNNYNEGETNKMVQIGRDRQEKGEIKPYFAVCGCVVFDAPK